MVGEDVESFVPCNFGKPTPDVGRCFDEHREGELARLPWLAAEVGSRVALLEDVVIFGGKTELINHVLRDFGEGLLDGSFCGSVVGIDPCLDAVVAAASPFAVELAGAFDKLLVRAVPALVSVDKDDHVLFAQLDENPGSRRNLPLALCGMTRWRKMVAPNC